MCGTVTGLLFWLRRSCSMSWVFREVCRSCSGIVVGNRGLVLLHTRRWATLPATCCDRGFLMFNKERYWSSPDLVVLHSLCLAALTADTTLPLVAVWGSGCVFDASGLGEFTQLIRQIVDHCRWLALLVCYIALGVLLFSWWLLLTWFSYQKSDL